MSAPIIRDISGIFSCDFSQHQSEVSVLAIIRKYDEYTYLHSLNVAQLSVSLGRRLGLEGTQLVDLGWAALLHDIGKLHVPLEILNKAKKFTPAELSMMQAHPVEAILAYAETQPVTLEGLRRLSAAFEHHQRFDLKGYPSVQKKLNLHPFSRIVAICDTFDAMTTDRIYQRRVLPDVALKIMAQGFGTVFDPLVLQAFITSLGAYPVGSAVRLNDETLAIVVHYDESSDMDRPHVVRNSLENFKILNLMDSENLAIKILRSEFPEDHDIDVHDYLERFHSR